MKTCFLALTVAVAAMTAPALAAEPVQGAKTAKADPAAATTTIVLNEVTGSQTLSPAEPRPTCRREQRPATNIPGRTICMTPEEWSDLERGKVVHGYRNLASARR